jgi:hypothetical protein
MAAGGGPHQGWLGRAGRGEATQIRGREECRCRSSRGTAKGQGEALELIGKKDPSAPLSRPFGDASPPRLTGPEPGVRGAPGSER